MDHSYLKIKVVGTGRTTGHVISCIVTNNSQQFLAVEDQTFYIPSNGNFQDYIVSIPDGIVIPPESTVSVPGIGYCGSARKPPVTGEIASTDDWIVLDDPVGPFISELPTSRRPDSVMGSLEPPVVSETIKLVESSPLFFHDYSKAHPGMEHLPGVPGGGTYFIADEGAHKTERYSKINEPDIPMPYTLTYPGIDSTINGYFTEDIPDSIYAPLLLDVVRRIEKTVPVIQESGLFPTPFSPDPVKEMNAISQQVIWIYTSGFFGNDYTKDEFTEQTYKEAERTIGVPIEDLPDEQQESLQNGVDQFWATYTATGVAAKLIDPNVDVSKTGISEEGEDYLYNLVIRKKAQCKCDSVTFKLLVEHKGFPYMETRFNAKTNPRVYMPDLEYGTEFYVQISEIKIHCTCGIEPCEFYPLKEKNNKRESGQRVLPVEPELDQSKEVQDPFDVNRPGQVDIVIKDDGPSKISARGNHNCTMKNDHWVDEDRDAFGFTIIPKDEGSTNAAVFQRLELVSYCKLKDCLETRCSEYITISFVNVK